MVHKIRDGKSEGRMRARKAHTEMAGCVENDVQWLHIRR